MDIMRKRFFIFAIMVMICSVTIGQTKYSQELVNKAEAGNAEAQFNLGSCYADGYGISQDDAKAVYWFTKAAEQGVDYAQYNLGMCYYFGKGVRLDYTMAVYWYTKAAEKGNAKAQSNLGLCYEKGKGVSQDYVKAVYWYTKAAEQGNDYAQYNLGLCYFYGLGVNQDKDKAIYWCGKAAASSNIYKYNTQLFFAFIYYTSGNYAKAVKYLAIAKESDDDYFSGSACNLLSKCYRFGRGVPQDVSKADELQAEAEAKGCGGDINELIKKLKEEYSIIK